MAPVGEAYFPPLDRCLSGGQQLWSWKICFDALARTEYVNNESLKKFLCDPRTQDYILNPLSPYPPPELKAKAAFQTRTSAVNAAQPSHANYNIGEIKEDVTWLSEVANIDEVSSLRIAILEWQARAASDLLEPPEESAVGGSALARSTIALSNGHTSLLQSANGNGSQENSHISRRRRLAETLLSERRYLLKCAEFIFCHFLCDGTGYAENDAVDGGLQWLADIGASLLQKWAPEPSPKGKQAAQKEVFFLEAIEGLRSRLQSLGVGSGLTGLESEAVRVEECWGSSQAIEIVHILEIIRDILHFYSSPVEAEFILPWFRLMSECAFLEGFQLQYPGFETTYNLPIQSLTSLISLSILHVTATLDLLAQSSTSGFSPTPTGPLPYIFNRDAIKEINNILIDVAPLSSASPCVMAWSIITQTVREAAMAAQDSRETRQSIRAADRFGAEDNSDNEAYERPTTRGMSTLRRRSSTGSDASQHFIEEIYDSLSAEAAVNDDAIAYLAKNAAEGAKVFEVIDDIARQYCSPYGFEHNGVPDKKMRACLLDLIRACLEFVEYQPALIMATIAAVTGSERYWDLVDKPSSLARVEPASLRRDEVLRQRIFLVALSRFPYESMPLFELCQAMAHQEHGNGSQTLLDLDTFTCMLPQDYQGYENVREDEELDYIQLTEDYTFVLSSPEGQPSKVGGRLALRNADAYNATHFGIKIAQGTEGQVLSDGKPLVVAWNHEFSGLVYIGQILQCASSASLSDESPNSPIASDVVAEAIAFLSILLSSAMKQPSSQDAAAAPHETATLILGAASDGLDRDEDIVSVIFKIFEKELYSQPNTRDSTNIPHVLVACIRYTHALLAVFPDRVWPFLGRSRLLAIGEDGGRLNAIISSYEIVSGHYEFLFGCIRLYDALIEDTVRHAVSRRTTTQAVARFGEANSFGSGVSRPTMEKVLTNLQRTMMEVLDSFGNWKFVNLDERAEIGCWLCRIFTKLVNYTHGTDNNSPSKLVHSLLPAARMALDGLLSQGRADFTLRSIIQICTDGMSIPSTSIPIRGEKWTIDGTMAALGLISTLMEASEFLGQGPSHLQAHLSKAMPTFARLYAARPEYRLPVVTILDALVRSPSPTEQQPPSLLTHLGQQSASRLLEILSTLGKPIDDGLLDVAIWGLLGSMLGTRQQWFAHFVLTGYTQSHRGTNEQRSEPEQRADPMFALALDHLSSIEGLQPPKALAMLDFVSSAVDFWPHMLNAINDHPEFMKAISEYASSNGLTNDGRLPQRSNDYHGLKVFSRIADIMAMYVHWTQTEGNPRFAEETLKHLQSLAKNAVATPDYNNSLHSNLRQNFHARFPGCNLTDFQRTGLRPGSMGDSFFYDLDLADKMLSFEPAWHGRKGRGFADEMRRANVNLSVVDAQVSLFQSWKSLLLELSGPLAMESKYQKIIAQTIVECLQANAENYLPDSFFQRLAQSRADLAFTLLETLNLARSKEPEVQSILETAWNTLRSHNDDVAAALGADDADYHRLLIRVLYLAIQLHTSQEVSPSSETNNASQNALAASIRSRAVDPSVRIALEIIARVVSQGFRSLTSLLHESPNLVLPSDFSILTANLNTCLRIPGLARNPEHLMAAFTDTQTPRCAAALLSWSDQLAATTSGDPIYGEIAMLFLLEISTVPALAESLAVEGVLSYILTTNLMGFLQDKAFGPFDTPPRMYAIWARGLLPLVLNMLHAVGPPIGAEVAAALNTFPIQLARASQAFGTSHRKAYGLNNGLLTLSVAQEAHCLALIVSILRTYREAGASAAIEPGQIEEIRWDAVQVKDDVEGWLQRKGTLRDQIVPTSAKEEGWSKMKPLKEGLADSRLEEKVLMELRGVVGVLGVREG